MPLHQPSELKVTGQPKVTQVRNSKADFNLTVLPSRESTPDPRRATACPEPQHSRVVGTNHTDTPVLPGPECHTCLWT